MGIGRQIQESKHSPLDYNRLVNINAVTLLYSSFCRGNCYMQCIMVFYYYHTLLNYMTFFFCSLLTKVV